MVKILIADDEQLERTSLKSIMCNKYGDKVTLLEAKNGREAIEICDIEKPHIVIMDIKMPGINGIQAIKKIKTFLPNTYFLILTAYDYFDYAKEAIEIGVKEYVLKPFDRKGFLEKIDSALDYIYAEKEKLKSQIEAQEKMYNVIPILENELSYSIVNDDLSTINYEMYMECLNISFKKGYCIVVRLDEYHNNNEKYDKKVKVSIGEYLKDFINRIHKVICSYKFKEYIVFFIDCEEDVVDYEMIIDSINFSKTMEYEIRRKFNTSLVIGIGGIYKGIENMYLSYLEACKCINNKQSSTNVMHYSDIDKLAIITDNESENKININNYNRELFNGVINYITENYNKDITLEKISQKFNLSLYYFSRMFKKVFGVSFSEKLTAIRMEKAKELLEKADSNIKDVCYEVGYNDPNYFSRAFKRHVGISPLQYKNEKSAR